MTAASIHANTKKPRTARTAVALFVLILIVRIIYVSLFAVQTPFWDQWDAEAAGLLKPWQEGSWSIGDLLAPHNEHRIAFTRLYSLLVFELNGEQWNNLVSAYFNAPLVAAYLTLLFVFLSRGATTYLRTATLVATAVIGILPFGWENFLVGFQSQFYFMALFAMLALGLTAYRSPSVTNACLVGVIAALSLLTTAGGLIGGAAVIAVVFAKSWREGRLGPGNALLIVFMVTTISIGIAITPVIPGHADLVAASLREELEGLLTALIWPVEALPGSHFRIHFKVVAALLLWLPCAIWVWRFIRSREATPAGFFALGVATWGFVQALAIAHSRAHGLVSLPSRYMDVPAISLVANTWFAFQLISEMPREMGVRILRVSATALFVLTATYGFYSRRNEDLGKLASRTHFTGIETANIAGYSKTGNPDWLDKPLLEIPYPDPKRLRTLLDDQTIIAMLPPELSEKPGGTTKTSPSLTKAAYNLRDAIRKFVNGVAPHVERIEPHTVSVTTDATRG